MLRPGLLRLVQSRSMHSRSTEARLPRGIALSILALVSFLFGAGGTVDAQTATLTIGSATAAAGSSVDIATTMSTSAPSSGVSLGVAHDANLTLAAPPVFGAALDAAQGGFDPAFSFLNLAFDPLTSESGYTAGIVFDINSMITLPANVNHEILVATYMVNANAAAGSSLPLTVSAGLGPVTGGVPVVPVVVLGVDEVRIGDGLTTVAGSVQIPATSFLRGDADENGMLSLLDAIHTLRFMVNQPAPDTCIEVYDINGNGILDTTLDAIMLLQYLYNSGAPPVGPFPNCGTLGTYPLGCDSHAFCP